MCLFGATRAVFEAAIRPLRLLILPSLLGLWFSGQAGAQSVAETGATGEAWPRSLAKRICSSVGGTGALVLDAFGALAWLRGQPLVDPRRVAVMGWGHGGTAALDSVLATGLASLFEEDFAAAVALYPYCPGNIPRRYLAPILVLAGAEDDLMPAARCRRIAAKAETGGGMITLRVYEGAYYGFDDPDHGAPHLEPEVLNIERSPPRGATLGYDAAAHADARRRVRAFLDRLLGQAG